MSSTIDRRRFMQTAGVAAGAAGALWAAPAVLGTSNAFAGDSCVETGGMAWSSIPTSGNWPYAPTTGSARVFTVAATNLTGSHPAVNVRITVTPIGSPGAGQGSGGSNARGGVDQAVPYPNNPAPSGLNGVASYYVMNMSGAGAGLGYTFKIEFLLASNGTKVTVSKLEYDVLDIDRSTSGNQYKDLVWITQSGGVPTFTDTPKGANITGSGTAGSKWTSTNTSGVQDSTGTLHVTYTSAVDATTLNYAGAENRDGIQYVGIGDLKWCY